MYWKVPSAYNNTYVYVIIIKYLPSYDSLSNQIVQNCSSLFYSSDKVLIMVI